MTPARDPVDRASHRRAWAALSFSERRTILRAVNRGRALDTRRDATLAVGAARQQRRFWRWVWVFGPIVALPQLNRGVDVFLTNLVVGTLIVGGMAAWFHRQARLAEAANLEVAARKGATKKKRKRGGGTANGRATDHLPGAKAPPPGPVRRGGKRRRR